MRYSQTNFTQKTSRFLSISEELENKGFVYPVSHKTNKKGFVIIETIELILC